jgi:integrase/recombinase XerD
MHSKKRGKSVKQSRTVSTNRKQYSLEILEDKVMSDKRAEGLAETTIWRYQHAFNLLAQFLERS